MDIVFRLYILSCVVVVVAILSGVVCNVTDRDVAFDYRYVNMNASLVHT